MDNKRRKTDIQPDFRDQTNSAIPGATCSSAQASCCREAEVEGQDRACQLLFGRMIHLVASADLGPLV